MIINEEKEVLEYFFTNTDKPIFATKNFHPEVWALMQARYSRSREGLREGFIKLLQEDPENFRRLRLEIEKTQGGLETKHATEKAIQFMEKWVLGYGHSSVAEGAVIGIGLEGVSILATKVIEDNRLCSYIEKSTRYVSFDEGSFLIDKDLSESEFSEEVKQLYKDLFKIYLELHEPVLVYVKKVAPLEVGMTNAAWERACQARRFDSIRYILPTATKTSLGWTVNARQLAWAISKLLSHPLREMNEIGLMVKEEAGKLLPSLLRFAEANTYLIETESEMPRLMEHTRIGDAHSEQVALVRGPHDGEDTIIASIIYKYKQTPFKQILSKVKKMKGEEKEKILDEYLQRMGNFDWPMRELEHSQFTFDIIMDYGAFRDLQRHRICTQTNQVFNSDLGYDVPNDIIKSGCEKEYREAMEKAKRLYEKVRREYPLQAQYLLPLGFKKRYLLTMNLREIFHLVKVRTGPLGHESYRKIARAIYDELRLEYPLLAKYITCNYQEEQLGRLKSEEQTEKLTKIGPL